VLERVDVGQAANQRQAEGEEEDHERASSPQELNQATGARLAVRLVVGQRVREMQRQGKQRADRLGPSSCRWQLPPASTKKRAWSGARGRGLATAANPPPVAATTSDGKGWRSGNQASARRSHGPCSGTAGGGAVGARAPICAIQLPDAMVASPTGCQGPRLSGFKRRSGRGGPGEVGRLTETAPVVVIERA